MAAKDAFWRPSSQMGVLNTDHARRLPSPGLPSPSAAAETAEDVCGVDVVERDAATVPVAKAGLAFYYVC